MALEAAVIIVDNSEYSRNGDYAPNRLEAQVEAAQYLASSRRAANVENSIALMCTTPPTLLVSLTSSDAGRYSAALGSIRIGPASESGLESSLRIASARIITMLAGPLQVEDESRFVDLLKGLKKNGIAVNFISLGSESMAQNRPILERWLSVLDDSACTLTEVEPTTFSLNEVLRTVPELTGQDGSAAAGGDFYGGVDPELDPELALALKLSLEEEQSRQARQQQQQSDEPPQKTSSPQIEEEEEEDEELQKAIQMSMQQ